MRESQANRRPPLSSDGQQNEWNILENHIILPNKFTRERTEQMRVSKAARLKPGKLAARRRMLTVQGGLGSSAIRA